MSVKHLVNVSGGTASAVALWRVIERFGRESVAARFANVRNESADTYRFIRDVERFAGIEIEYLDQGKNCWDIWLDRLMFTDPVSGGCVASYHLKKLPLSACADSLGTPEETTIYVGFGYDEDDRCERLRRAGAPWKFDFPLCWKPILSRCDVDDECRARGVEPPNAYAKGYPHNNCDGFCILAGIKQWAGKLKDDPEGYAVQEANEQTFRDNLAEAGRKDHTILKDRRGGVTRNLSLKQLREEIESGIRDHDDSWRNTPCSCIGDLFSK